MTAPRRTVLLVCLRGDPLDFTHYRDRIAQVWQAGAHTPLSA